MNLLKSLVFLCVVYVAAAEEYAAPMTDVGHKGGLRQKIQNFIDKFPALKKLVEESSKTTTTVVRRVTNRGFTTFSQSASMQALDGISPSDYPAFTEAVLDMINLPEKHKEKVKLGVFEALPFMKRNEWHAFNFIFNLGPGGKSKYVNILAHNDGGKAYDFVIADMQTSFTLAPDIFVVTEKKSSLWGAFGSSKTIVRQQPASIKLTDMETLMEFFDMAAFTRFAKMLNMPMGYESYAVDPMTILAGVTAGVDLWGKITSAFKTKITNEIVKEIAGEGFDKFAMHSVAHVVEGLRPDKLDRYMALFPRIYDVPEKYKANVKDILELSQWVSKNTWQKNDMLFDVNSGGSNKWMTILSSVNNDGSYNFLVCTVRQTFKLAPDVLVIKTSKSIAGGIYESEKFTRKKIPRSLKESDLEQLTNFFHIITFKRFAAAINMQIKQSDPQINM